MNDELTVDPTEAELLEDLNGDLVGKFDRVAWASTSYSPHPKVGTIINLNMERGTVTVRADTPRKDRGSVATVPAERVLRVSPVPAILPAVA